MTLGATKGEARPSTEIEDADVGVAAETFSGALPKEEIQAIDFLSQHPDFDGRGVIIAIFDTGVDPGVAGLQTTTDGKPKIIDVVDCSGSGDVDCSKAVNADEQGCVEGVYGNKMQLNPSWVNPTGQWHVGAKAAYELFPAGLKKRTKEERRRRFEERQRVAVTAATSALAAHERAHGRTPSDAAVKKDRTELEARLKLLEEMMGKYEDFGPMIHCVLWHDGERWLAALDTTEFYDETIVSRNSSASQSTKDANIARAATTEATETAGQATASARDTRPGSLAEFEPLTNYRDCLRYGTFSAADACNFAINIYDEGSTLSIVVDAGSHGTHVAGIAAAHHPDAPGLNGIAPGAQIVSCKIGDTRLGSMETGVGLTRALITVLESKCDLINMSYGEATATPNAGRFIRLAEEIVNKHGVIYVSSAGNAGPALGTVGAAGGTSSAVLGVGAFVTPALASAGHSLREQLEEGAQYTWSSRGPAPDGDIGVNFSAPGGAIAPVPAWTTSKMQLMNGTSMASPCACGGIALIVSGLKAQNHHVTPALVRRAIENTAMPIGTDPVATLTSGRGLLQVAAAFDYLERGSGSHLHDTLRDLRLDVSVRRTDGTTKQRGIYLRDPADTLRPVAFAIEVNPQLKEDADVRGARLEVDLKLAVSSTASWVKTPSLLMLHHNGRSFEVEIDPTGLSEGVHYAEVQGIQVGGEWRGPLFRVPITVIKPLQLTAQAGRVTAVATRDEIEGATVHLGAMEFVPGKELRRFVAVPEGATWAELRLRAVRGETQKHYMLRATAVLPHTRYSDSEHRASVQLSSHAHPHVAVFSVAAGTSLELTLAQFWSSLGDSTLDAELTFHGVQVSAATHEGLVVDGGAFAPLKVTVRAPLRRERIKPSAKLDTVRIPVRPSESELAPLSAPRDILPGGRTLHRLLLTYKVTLVEGGKVTPRVPLLNRFVYDSEVEAQMSFLCDGNKQVLAINDIYPSEVQLDKGDYIIRLHIRHDDPTLLETLRNLPIVLDRKIDPGIALPIRAMAGHAVKLGTTDLTGKERTLVPGERKALFIGPLADETKLPKDAAPGRVLAGKLSVGLKSAGNGDAPGAAVLTYIVPPKKVESAPSPGADGAGGTDAEDKKEKKSSEDLLKEAVRDAEVKFLKGMKTESAEERVAYEKLLQELNGRWPGHLPILQEPVKRLTARKQGLTKESDERDIQELLPRIVAAADAVLSAIDTTELAVYMARKTPEEGAGAAARKKEMDEKKAAVIEALAAKCSALMDLEDGVVPCANTAAPVASSASPEEASEPQSNPPTKSSDEVEAAYEELRKWIDPVSDPAHAALASRREERAGRLAGALKAMEKSLKPEDGPPKKSVLERRIKLLKQLGWDHWVNVEEARLQKAFPPGWPPL